MIELTWGQIRNQEFFEALQRLHSIPLPFKVGYTVGRIVARVDSQLKEAQGEFLKIVGKHADIDAAGNYKVREGQQDAFRADMEAFQKNTFTIDKSKINIDLFPPDVRLSGGECLALEPILFGLEVLEGGKHEISKENRQEESGEKSEA
jgi:hypothetical protein